MLSGWPPARRAALTDDWCVGDLESPGIRGMIAPLNAQAVWHRRTRHVFDTFEIGIGSVFPFFSFNSHGVAQMHPTWLMPIPRLSSSPSRFSDAWNRHDSHAVAMRYVEDGDFSSTQGIPSHGAKDWKSTTFPSSELSEERSQDGHCEEYSVSDSVDAQVDIDWQMTGAKTPDGADAPPAKVCSTG